MENEKNMEKAKVTNYDLYRDSSKDSLHPRYHSSTGVLKELYRWFGPSPMRAPLNLRINNRQIMIKQHVNLLGGDAEKRVLKRTRGELRHSIEQTKWGNEGKMKKAQARETYPELFK